MNAGQRREAIEYLVENGMPEDLAPRAVDALDNLRQSCPNVRDWSDQNPEMSKYFFFQGFVAGYTAAVHHN